MKVFVGYDTREDIAYQVCKHSIITKQPKADVRPLKQQELRDAGWYTRTVDKLASTEFTFTRFLIPELTNFKGWALFMDCDMILTTDIKELFDQADDRYAVMCVQHDPRHPRCRGPTGYAPTRCPSRPPRPLPCGTPESGSSHC